MNPADIIENFEKGDILEETPDDDIALSDDYLSVLRVEMEAINRINPQKNRLCLEHLFDDAGFADDIYTRFKDEVEVLASIQALSHFVNNISKEEVITVLLLLKWIKDVPEENDGAPRQFTSINWDQLMLAQQLGIACVVYIWRKDCPPCETMNEVLEKTFDARNHDIALFALYGPKYSQQLAEQYDVVGGPTVLFMKNGRVDSRLVGVYNNRSINHELNLLMKK